MREVVTVAWDPRPWEPVEGVLRARSVLELAAQQADYGAEGKMVVRTVALSHLQSSRGWTGTPRSVFGVLPGAVQLVLFSLPRSLRPQNRLERPGVGP